MKYQLLDKNGNKIEGAFDEVVLEAWLGEKIEENWKVLLEWKSQMRWRSRVKGGHDGCFPLSPG